MSPIYSRLTHWVALRKILISIVCSPSIQWWEMGRGEECNLPCRDFFSEIKAMLPTQRLMTWV